MRISENSEVSTGENRRNAILRRSDNSEGGKLHQGGIVFPDHRILVWKAERQNLQAKAADEKPLSKSQAERLAQLDRLIGWAEAGKPTMPYKVRYPKERLRYSFADVG